MKGALARLDLERLPGVEAGAGHRALADGEYEEASASLLQWVGLAQDGADAEREKALASLLPEGRIEQRFEAQVLPEPSRRADWSRREEARLLERWIWPPSDASLLPVHAPASLYGLEAPGLGWSSECPQLSIATNLWWVAETDEKGVGAAPPGIGLNGREE